MTNLASRVAPDVAPVVRAFVERQRIPREALRSDGRLVLTIDRRWRVHIVSAPHHRVALQAELMGLPDRGDRRLDDLLLRLATAAAGLMQQHASTLCIDRSRQALVLQQQLPADADPRRLREALADFANALAFWSRLCAGESQPPQPVGALA